MVPVKIKALNQDSSDESNEEEEENPITKEALEQKLQLGYREALILQKQNKLGDAEQLLLQLVENDVLKNAEGKVKYLNGKLQPSIFHLKYCCYLNLGNIMFKTDRYKLALDYFTVATEIDDTDLNLWYKIGKVAMKIPNLMYAISAFSESLFRNPKHWPSLNAIITATYAVENFMECLMYIHQGLKLDLGYVKGRVFRDKIFKNHPYLKTDFFGFFPNMKNIIENVETCEYDEEIANKLLSEAEELRKKDPVLNKKLFGAIKEERQTKALLKPLKSYSWLCLGKALLKLYTHLYNDDTDDMGLAAKINLKFVPDNKKTEKTLSNVHNIEEPQTDATVDNQNPQEPQHISNNCIPESSDPSITEIKIVASENQKSMEENKAEDRNLIDDVESKNNCNKSDDDDDDNEDGVLKEINAMFKTVDSEKEAEGNFKSKRRKSPIPSEQLKMCDKRRSTRNRTILKNNEPSLSKILKTIIPVNLLPRKETIIRNFCDVGQWNEDSMDTMDIYRVLFENLDQNLPSCPVNQISEQARSRLLQEDGYFGSEKEKSDIEWYINIYNELSIMELLEAYTKELAKKWSYIFPAKLSDIFLEMRLIIKKNQSSVHILENGGLKEYDEESLKSLKDNLLAVLLYGELLLNQYLDDITKEHPLGNSYFGGNFPSLLFGEMHDACCILNAIESNVTLWMRTLWMEAVMFLQKKDLYASCSALTLLVEDIPDSKIEVRLPNIKQFYVISQISAKRLLNTLQRNENLNQVKPLFAEKQYNSVVEILQNALKPDSQQLIQIPNENTLTRYQQYTILLAALMESKNYEELFKWCEVGCYEAFAVYRKSFFDDNETDMKSKWASLVINTLDGMLWCLKIKKYEIFEKLSEEHRTRLVQTLTNIVCHQIEASETASEILTSFVTPWLILCNIMKFNEQKLGIGMLDDENAEVTIAPSISLLFVAHEYLGKRKWCCDDNGSLLFYTLETIEELFKRSLAFSETWQTLGYQIDQIFYCLYSRTIKRNKPRYVVDHGTFGLALTWNRAVQAYSFYRPTQLPMFDAVSKYHTISADTETLLKHLIDLVPAEQNPAGFLDNLNQYLNGTINDIPTNENSLIPEVMDVFYLLGDYNFKNKIMDKAIKYYSLDLCINPRRVDSWAAMALARGSKLELKLNSCEVIKNESDILKNAKIIDRCYETALNLDPNQSTLWIERGVFCYSIHGFCSRLLKQETNLSLKMFDMLENNKNEFLKTAFDCFNSANKAWIELTKKQEEVQDERWLNHYMLGKIAEKNEEKLGVFLNHYLKAALLLHQNGAEYPARISHSAPQYYSIEVLEIYYRTHTSILKLLETHEEKPLDDVACTTLERVMKQLNDSPFALAIPANGKTLTSETNKQNKEKNDENKNESLFQNIEKDVRDVVEDIISKVSNNSIASVPKRKSSETEDPEIKSKIIKLSDSKAENTPVDLMNKRIDNVSGISEFNPTISVDQGLSDTCTSSSSSRRSSATSNSSDSEEQSKESKSSEETEDEKRSRWKKLHQEYTKKCLSALELCITRFPQHYKSYYRLANHYFRSKLDKDTEKSKKYLLQDGLFSDRKVSNFFNGVWRIPTGEIDRSGSFAFHMSRSVHLLMDILRDTQDYKTLLNLAIQLKDKPDPEKKYIRDNEREQICKEALSLSFQTLKKNIDCTPLSESEENKRMLLLEVFKCYQMISKYYTQKDAPFGKLLVAAFYTYSNRKDKVNLEQIVSLCKKSINNQFKSTFLPLTTMDAEHFKPLMPSQEAKLQSMNFMLHPETEIQNQLQRMSNEARAMLSSPIPKNLKHLPSITVSAVAKSKHPSSDLWAGKNIMNLLKKKDDFSPLVRKQKEKEIKQKRKLKALKMSYPGILPIKKKTNIKTAGFPSSSTQATQASSVLNDKGITITPVMYKEPKVVPSMSNRVFPTPQSHKTFTNFKPDISPTDLSSIVITPVEPSKSQPTLQQKLAAKLMANVALSPKTSSSHGNSSGSKQSNLNINKNVQKSSFELSKTLGSSGVSIFPLPMSDPKSVNLSVPSTSRPSSTIFQNQQLHISKVGGSITHSKKYTSSMNVPKAHQNDVPDLMGLKNFNKGLIIEPAVKNKPHDNLKNTLKALEESSNVIITPKMKKPDLKIITLD